MKVSINQVKINRVGINTAQVRGIRLGSASKGGQTSPFHPSLVDYWNFKGKSNFDKDRNIIKGVKGNIFNAYNFGWSLGSGYGLFKENYLTYNKVENVFVTDDHSVTIMNFVPANKWVIYKYGNPTFKSTKIKVTGITADNQLEYGYSPSLEGARVMMPIPKDGIYDLPESVTNQAEFNIGFFLRSALTKNVTIEQIPEYEGAIVTDGVDDYLKLDKVGYKIGTVIVKFVPIKFNVGWNTVFDNNKYDSPNRNFLGYSSTIENRGTTMFVSNYGDYLALYHNTPKQANDSLYISSSYTESFTAKEFFSMALYDIAIYQDVLTAEEIQKEINVMEYGTPNPVFALNFDNFAYKAVDYPEFATGKVTTKKIVIDSTTTQMNGFIVAAYNPELTTGDAIELPSYKVKVTGIDAYGNLGDGYWAVALMGMPINASQDPWVYLFYKDGIYDIPAISLSESIYNLAVMCQIMVDKPIEIEILYDKNITKSFPETKQIFP
ncbi:hypothetical protein J8K84_11430 [Bacteroides fragilis]|jgi:hypothetical protein|uniref:hypothetical protein n=1 Tax=Bacteroides fragilis TaxID=817 RepID=UPI0020309102|nr:hypothetical protein [Bacteroides fragilis]MCM0335667.1 hypothetical protein [Bacteroides fragilis]